MGYTISEEEQINILKNYCHKNEVLIHLGDVGNPIFLEQLKCYKVLIMGNHDQSIDEMKEYFDEVYPGPLWISEKILLSHEPMWVENCITHNPIVFNIHGHDHGKTICEDEYHLNLAQNVFGYIPLNLKTFINSGKLKNINSIHRDTINEATRRKSLQGI